MITQCDTRSATPFCSLRSVLAAGAQTLIDNDQVRVLKVIDQPHVKTAPHEHKVNRVMVYLNAGKQEFVSSGKTTLAAVQGRGRPVEPRQPEPTLRKS